MDARPEIFRGHRFQCLFSRSYELLRRHGIHLNSSFVLTERKEEIQLNYSLRISSWACASVPIEFRNYKAPESTKEETEAPVAPTTELELVKIEEKAVEKTEKAAVKEEEEKEAREERVPEPAAPKEEEEKETVKADKTEEKPVAVKEGEKAG